MSLLDYGNNIDEILKSKEKYEALYAKSDVVTLVRNHPNYYFLVYTYLHRQAFKRIEIKLRGGSESLCAQFHDLDKMYFYLFDDKPVVKEKHHSCAFHHLASFPEQLELTQEQKTKVCEEIVIDWECSGYTKIDKKQNAIGCLFRKNDKYSLEMRDLLYEALEKFGLAQGYAHENVCGEGYETDYRVLFDSVKVEEIVADLGRIVTLNNLAQGKGKIL